MNELLVRTRDNGFLPLDTPLPIKIITDPELPNISLAMATRSVKDIALRVALLRRTEISSVFLYEISRSRHLNATALYETMDAFPYFESLPYGSFSATLPDLMLVRGYCAGSFEGLYQYFRIQDSSGLEDVFFNQDTFKFVRLFNEAVVR